MITRVYDWPLMENVGLLVEPPLAGGACSCSKTTWLKGREGCGLLPEFALEGKS